MRTRLSMCAGSPEARGPLPPEKTRRGDQGRDQLGVQAEAAVSAGLLGAEGPSCSSRLWIEGRGEWWALWAGRVQLIHVEESISKDSN